MKLMMLITLVFMWPLFFSPSTAEIKIIDLTYNLDKNSPIWPGAGFKRLKRLELFKGYLDTGLYLESSNIEVAEHYGTHMDSPKHMCPKADCWHAHEVPASRLRGEGVVIDISSRASWPDNRDAEMTVEDLREWERKRHRCIPDGAIVLVYSGWGKYWQDEVKYLGSVNNGSDLHFPGVSPEAASWIVKNRPHISMVGVDTISVDAGQSLNFSTHQTLFRSNIMVLENVAHLDELLALAMNNSHDVEVVAMPLKIVNGSGSPARVVAYVSDEKKNSTPRVECPVPFAMAMAIAFCLRVMVRL